MPISSSSGHPVASGDAPPSDLMLCADGTFRAIDVSVPRSGSILPIVNGGTGRTAAVITLVSKPNDPNTTTSATLVMMGLGSAWTITPASSGKIHIFIIGEVTTNTQVVTTWGARFGTGTAPSNAATVSGTAFGSKADFTTTPSAAGIKVPFAFTDILALTVGTAYWFDLALGVTGGVQTGSLTNLAITAMEIA